MGEYQIIAMAAGMIDAYYSLDSDSAKLFKGTKISLIFCWLLSCCITSIS